MEAVARHTEGPGIRKLVGGVLVGVGAALLLASGAYYAYGAWAGSRLDELNVARERPAPIEPLETGAAAAVQGGEVPASDTPAVGQAAKPSAGVSIARGTKGGTRNPAGNVERTEPLGIGEVLGPKRSESSQAAVEAPSSDNEVSVYQAMVSQDPQPAIMARIFEATRAEAATYASPSLADLSGVGLGPATRIRIPVLNIDSEIKELEVVRTADSSAWETPKHIVGHIPTTPVPGGDGQGWYFGHLESPIRGEGNVFQRLPEIAKLLEREDTPPIYIFLESKDRKFVYQVYRTEGMPREELRISDSGAEDITLVTCTPRFVYDQRLLVTAALVGVLDT